MLALLGRAVFSGGLALDLAAVIGLLGFLAWILSGILRPQIELEEAVRGSFAGMSGGTPTTRWRRQEPLTAPSGPTSKLRRMPTEVLPSDIYEEDPFLCASSPVLCYSMVQRLRRWLRWRFLQRIF
jgi:hypothetical protein